MPLQEPQTGVEQFVHDDDGYVHWLEANPHGFVVNSFLKPTTNYLKLHRSACKHINSPTRTNWTTTGYIKTCSIDLQKLSGWAKEAVGGTLQPCPSCKPEFPRNAVPHGVPPVVRSTVVAPAPAPVKPQSLEISRPTGNRSIPTEISTGCPELDLVWRTYAVNILRSPILIPDTEDDLNWHAFLGHSLDMQGFRAAEFVGVDSLTKKAPTFVPLREKGIGIRELGSLWEIKDIREHLFRTSGTPFESTLEALRKWGGDLGQSLAESFERFPHRKFHSTVRAYLQNSAALKDCGFSFRRWLQREVERVGVNEFPPKDFRMPCPSGNTLEQQLRYRLQESFYQVGPAMAPYMLCDWQLWLWNEGMTGVFANFKLDSFHEEFVRKFGRGLLPTDETGFANWWLERYPEIPPRLANECIWLGLEHKAV